MDKPGADLIFQIISQRYERGSTIITTYTRPNRFVYVHTPKHGSWLNLVETLFGKMARTFLRGIRVKSWEELQTRILQGIAEINAAPVVHRWGNFTALDATAYTNSR